MSPGEQTDGVIKSGATLFAVVDGLKELDGAQVTELAEHLDLPPSTTHRHLKTLRNHEYVYKNGGEYRLGFKFLDVGGYVRKQHDVTREIKDTIRKLANETNELSAFIVEDHGLGVFVHRYTSNDGVHSDARIGKRVPLHLTSGGKAILANLPSDRLQEILDQRGLPSKTPNSITEYDDLVKELKEIRERGYAFGRGENTVGLHSVGAPVHGPNDQILGAITVAGPAHRMEAKQVEEEIVDLLLKRVNEFELNFSYA